MKQHHSTTLRMALILSLWVQPQTAYPQVLHLDGTGQVLVPVASITVLENTCDHWKINQTYKATLFPREAIEILNEYKSYSVDDHYHAATPGSITNGIWRTSYWMYGTPEAKLRAINQSIFGTELPVVGQTKTYTTQHDGTCAAEQNMRECVGVFVHASTGEHVTPTTVPTTLPAGFCVGIPPANASCSFETSNALIDLGTGGMGKRAGRTIVSYSCTRPTTYRASMIRQPDDSSGIQIENVRVDGKTLPATGTYQKGVQHAQVDVEAVVTKEGSLGTSRVLYIDIP